MGKIGLALVLIRDLGVGLDYTESTTLCLLTVNSLVT